MNGYKIKCTNPDCARSIRVPAEAVGRRVRCPACKQEIRVPGSIEELRALEDQKNCRIRVAKGPAFVGTVHVLEPDRAYTFGKSDTCDVQLPGPTVSKRHFSLHFVNNQWVLEDLNTTTGTQVNGLTVTKQALTGDETIEVGAYVLLFENPAGSRRAVRATTGAVVRPATDAEPLPIHEEPDSGDPSTGEPAGVAAAASPRTESSGAVKEAERQWLQSQGFDYFKREHLDQVGQDSQHKYTLSLATRLALVAGLLVLATALSLFGKYWFFDRPSSQGINAPAPTDAIVEKPLPPAFETALAAKDFKVARTIFDETKADSAADPEVVRRMDERLRWEINNYWNELRQRVQEALGRKKWDDAKQVVALARAPELGRLPDDWTIILNALAIHDRIAEAEGYQTQERWADASAALDKADKLEAGNGDVARAREALANAMAGGLFVQISPQVEGIQVTLGGKEYASAGREQWKLPTGPLTLRVTAPGFFDEERVLELVAGRMTPLDVKLVEKAPPEVWTLLALERADAAEACWLAAKHFADIEALPAAVTGPFAAWAENHQDFPKPRPLLIARITRKNGEQLTGRILSTTPLTVAPFPKGKTVILRDEEVAKKEDLDIPAAAEAVRAAIEAQHKDGQPLLDTLEQLARLRRDLEAHAELAVRLCAPLAGDCLRHFESACASCAGGKTVPCATCAAKGFRLTQVTCPVCRGETRVPCSLCKGTGNVNCKECGGSGRRKERYMPPGGRMEIRDVDCNVCGHSGKVPCTNSGCRGGTTPCVKCHSKGQVEEKVDCPDCDKGRKLCPDCNGRGTKEGMLPEKRREAEVEAAQRFHPRP